MKVKVLENELWKEFEVDEDDDDEGSDEESEESEEDDDEEESDDEKNDVGVRVEKGEGNYLLINKEKERDFVFDFFFLF